MGGGSTVAILLAAIVTVACSTAKLPVDTTSASIDTVAAARVLIEDALAAKGGKAKLASLKSFRLIAVGTTTLNGKRLAVETTRVLVLPDKLRVDARLTPPGAPPLTVSVGLSGETGWQRIVGSEANDDAATELAGNNLDTVRFERWREPELILLKAADPAAVVTVVPDDTVVGGDVYSVVRLRSPFNVDLFLYIDKKTKLLGRMIYSDGKNSESDDFDDYRDVDGLQFAYKRTTSSGDRSNAFELEAVEVNPKIDVALFDKPAKNASAGSREAVADPPADRVAATLARMAQFRDEICRCDDQPCIDRVHEAIRRWQRDNEEYPTREPRPWTREESRRSADLSDELDICSTPGRRPLPPKNAVAAPGEPLVVAPPPPPPPPPRIVSAATLEANRITGEKNILPDDATRKAMAQRGGEFTGVFKVCVAPDGSVADVSLMQSTGFPSYDQTIMKQIRAWRYRPFTVRHAPPRVCAAMVFIYHAS